MKIILIENIKGLGQIGDIKEVKNGYARNFLIPKKFAILATEKNLKKLEEIKREKELKTIEEAKKMEEVAKKLRNLRITIEVKADEKGNLYAGINSKKISEELRKRGIEVDPEYILLNEPIKKLGVYNVLFKYYDIESEFEVEVV